MESSFAEINYPSVHRGFCILFTQSVIPYLVHTFWGFYTLPITVLSQVLILLTNFERERFQHILLFPLHFLTTCVWDVFTYACSNVTLVKSDNIICKFVPIFVITLIGIIDFELVLDYANSFLLDSCTVFPKVIWYKQWRLIELYKCLKYLMTA